MQAGLKNALQKFAKEKAEKKKATQLTTKQAHKQMNTKRANIMNNSSRLLSVCVEHESRSSHIFILWFCSILSVLFSFVLFCF